MCSFLGEKRLFESKIGIFLSFENMFNFQK